MIQLWTEEIHDCLKYDFAVRRGMPEDVLPLWVADMDFRTSSYVEDAFGTAVQRKESLDTVKCKGPYFDIVQRMDGTASSTGRWMKSWLVKTPGVVFALAMAVKALYRTGRWRC